MKKTKLLAHRLDSYAFAVTNNIHEAIKSECIPIVNTETVLPNEYDKRGMFFYENSEQLKKILDSLSFDLYHGMYLFVQKNLQTSYSRHASSSSSH